MGKSLLLQQLTLMALEAGREVHLLQWDTARQVFETPRYPLLDGATHPMVIKAVGLWLRQALVDWDRDHDSIHDHADWRGALDRRTVNGNRASGR